MNEFIETKIGEVLAFARIGKDTLTKGKEGFMKILDQEKMDSLDKEFTELEQKVSTFAAEHDVTDKVEESAKETSEKVTSMRDTYIDGNWDESSEVLEWTGFYTGASLVHWRLVNGAAKSLKMADLESLGKEAIDFYSSLFSSDEKFLANIGAKSVE
jgi:hypothetical protein